MAGLETWHQYEAGVSTNGLCKDYSGNGRDLVQASTPPTLTANILNGQPGWYFSGSVNPLVNATTITPKHIFILASFDDATFTVIRGLMSGQTTGDILHSNSSGSNFANVSADVYKKSDVLYAAGSQAAPVSGQPALIEIQFNAGVAINGTQIGYRRNVGGAFKGYFFENLAYSSVKTDVERWQIYRYFAMRYWLWQKNAAGLDVFPFIPNKSRSAELDEERYVSEPYSGDEKVLERGNPKSVYSTSYAARRQEEFNAAKQFWKTHRRPTHVIYRDYRFYPPTDQECKITSSLREQGSDVTMRFNYAQDFTEVG